MKGLLVMLIAAVVATGAPAQSASPGQAAKETPGDGRGTPGTHSRDSATSRGAAEGQAAPAKGTKPTAKMSPAEKNAAVRSVNKDQPRCPEGLTCTRGSDGSLRGPVGDFGPPTSPSPRAPIGTPDRVRPP